MDPRFELPEINTWRLYNKGVTQERVVQMVEAWEAHGYRFGTVCIDDGWTTDGKLGDWVPDPTRFPDLAGLARWIHRKGYALRLWVAPIQVHPGTEAFKKAFPKSVLHGRDGKPLLYEGLRTFKLDPRTPIGREHVRATMQRLVRDYDADAFKVDFPPFYEPHDAFFKQCDYDLPESDAQTMVPNFYRLVRESLDAVKPGVRVECAKDIAGCQPYVNDTICGDLVGSKRTMEELGGVVARVNAYAKGHAIVPWLEMAWGEGGSAPTDRVEWHAGLLEWVALSINFGLKLEHSFQPFDYPNADQVRILTNLYGARDTSYKVLHAGRRSFPVGEMLRAGIPLDARTRFLVAPQERATVTLATAALKTNALRWHARDVQTDAPVKLRARNEFWRNSPDACMVAFEAEALRAYELWHEGDEDPYFADLFATYPGKTAAKEGA
jgi:hypothetical protein